ncbi:hypothetical protein A3Q56_06268 [Intoshia linei]|uniref:PA14 domain-containing protein n=1 Tax=Intoshia linei TaxID=1819745 RepID=A0A177AVJ1_9BILA|nr:hypothetical protein A3Q56_06268 [Intoshia linei]
MKSIILAFLLVLWNFDYLNSISVNRVLPKLIGGGGEVLLVIRGTGFSTNSFSLIPDDPNVGNFVFLVNKKSRIVYNCKSHPNGMTSNQIQCFTPPLPLGSYFIRIKVDGQDIHDHNVYCGNTPEAWSCSFQVTIHDTPTITSLNPPTGLPGNLITIKGRIVTRFTNSTMFLKDSTNGITARFTRNFVGNNICYFNDINNKIIHIQLNGANEESLNGEFKCRFEGNYVGAHRAHFIIEQNFGKSIIDRNAMKICYNDIACLYESYAYINEISPVIVSSGMKMSIKGDYLSDETDALLIVEIANIPATILEKSDKELIVLVPDNSLIIILPDYPGNRGMTLELWRNKELAYAELDTITTLSKNDDGVILYESIILSNAQYILSENINIVGKMSGFFVPNIDSNYNFFLKTNGIAKFSISTDHTFDNNVLLIEIDTVTNGADNVFANNEVTLIAGTKYFFQVLFYHNVVDKFLNLGFFQYDSKVLSTVTSDAINEKQNIKIYTERILQIVEINFSAQTAEMSSITEYQSYQVLLIFIDPVATFRFCLNENFCTGILSSISTNELVESALNQIGGNNLFKVTIIVETNGNILYEISRESTSGLVFEQLSILEIVQGTITNTITSSPIPNDPLNEIYSTPFNFRLKFENEDTYYLTNEISFNATPDEIRTELFQSLSPNCPDRITTLDTTTYNGNYRNNYVPLCGKSFKSWVYGVRDGNAMPLSLTNNRYMCLGLRGYFSNYIRIRYYLNDIYTNYGINLPEIMENITIKEWTYTCFDIKSILNVPDALIYSNVYFYRHIRSDIKFIDEVSFVAERIHFDVKNERHVPAFMIEDATITMESSLLTLTLSYYDCVSSPTVSIITSLNVEPTISETSTASEGMTGNFDISYDGITSTIPVDANSIGVKNILNFGDNVSMDQLNVAMTGNCHEKTWTVTWIKNPGRKSLITVSSTSNTNGDVTIEKVNEGRSIFENIPASFSRSNHLTPQVSVTVNNIPVLNDVSSEIDIQYDESIRPEISNVSPDTGSSEDVLTIIGLNFDNVDITNNQVILGDDTLCEIQTVTPTEITCILGIGEKGLKNVSVNVEGKGISVANAIDFNYTYKFNEVSPLFGSTGGGTLLTISGSGFNNDPEVDVSITVGTSICKIVEIKIDQVVCYTSIGSIESAEIIYTENGVDSATSLVYSYSTTDTPQITSIDKATINIDEEDRILTFTGSLFINVDHVYIGGIKSRIIYYTESELAVMIPFLTDGNHEILIHTLKGYALETDNYPVISVDFKINQINYERISAIGGLEIQLIGSGFSLQNDKNRVKIGTVDCNVIESTDTTIKCINGNQSKKKDVDLMSGELYNSPININVGDRLQFIANSWDGSKHRLSFLIDDTEKKIHVIENNQLFADSIQFYDDNFVFSDTDEFIVISDLQNELNEFLVYTRLIIIPVESTLDKVTLK